MTNTHQQDHARSSDEDTHQGELTRQERRVEIERLNTGWEEA